MQYLSNINEYFEVLFDTVNSSPPFHLFLIGTLGLFFGSYASSLTYRLPREILAQSDNREDLNQLRGHRSICPNCKKIIGVANNVPVLSYIYLRGFSACCNKKISIRYPLIEFLMMSAFLTIALLMPFNWFAIFIYIAMFYAICLAVIDKEHFLLPDKLTLSLLVIGLMFSFTGYGLSFTNSFLGAGIGFISLFGVNCIYKLIRRKSGIGFGDVKYLAAIGSWSGIDYLFQILFTSALIAIIVTLSLPLKQLIISKLSSTRAQFKEGQRIKEKSCKLNEIPIPLGLYLSLSFYLFTLLSLKS